HCRRWRHSRRPHALGTARARLARPRRRLAALPAATGRRRGGRGCGARPLATPRPLIAAPVPLDHQLCRTPEFHPTTRRGDPWPTRPLSTSCRTTTGLGPAATSTVP